MYKFKNAKGEEKGKLDSEGQKLYIYGDIVGDRWDKWISDETCPMDVMEVFAEFDKDKPVDIYINSGGGDVFGALAICSIIKRHCGETTAHIDGIAASAASVIACACDSIIMPEYAQMMIHRPWGRAAGTVDDLQKACEALTLAEDSIVEIYKGKLAEGKTEEQLRDALEKETWLTGKTAFEWFELTVETSEPIATAASDFYSRYQRKPTELHEVPEDSGKADINAAIMAVFEKYFGKGE